MLPIHLTNIKACEMYRGGRRRGVSGSPARYDTTPAVYSVFNVKSFKTSKGFVEKSEGRGRRRWGPYTRCFCVSPVVDKILHSADSLSGWLEQTRIFSIVNEGEGLNRRRSEVTPAGTSLPVVLLWCFIWRFMLNRIRIAHPRF